MRAVNPLLRFWSYLFHLGISGFLLVSAVVARLYHQQLNLELLPFSQVTMISRATMLSLAGFICIFLGLIKVFEFVFPLWSLAVLGFLLYGFVLSPYQFSGLHSLKWPLLLLLGAVLALIGSVMVLLPKPRNFKRW